MFMIDSDGRRTWVDGADGYNDLSDEKKDSLNSCPSYHRETTTDDEIRKTNTSSVQFNINRGRK